jgi:hypothetical protein
LQAAVAVVTTNPAAVRVVWVVVVQVVLLL